MCVLLLLLCALFKFHLPVTATENIQTYHIYMDTCMATFICHRVYNNSTIPAPVEEEECARFDCYFIVIYSALG